jgi:hypothetical protein
VTERPYKLRIVYRAEGMNAETLSFASRRVRDDAYDTFRASPFVLSVEAWSELSSIPNLIRIAVEGV